MLAAHAVPLLKSHQHCQRGGRCAHPCWWLPDVQAGGEGRQSLVHILPVPRAGVILAQPFPGPVSPFLGREMDLMSEWPEPNAVMLSLSQFAVSGEQRNTGVVRPACPRARGLRPVRVAVSPAPGSLATPWMAGRFWPSSCAVQSGMTPDSAE